MVVITKNYLNNGKKMKMKIMLLGRTHTPCQNGLLIRRELEALGHEVVYVLFPGTLLSEIHRLTIQHDPDVLLQTGGRNQGAQHLEEAKKRGIPIALWYADAYGLSTKEDEKYFLELQDFVDVAFVSCKGIAEELKAVLGMNAVWLPQYFDNVHFSSTTKRLPDNQEIFDCCFIGNNYDPRLGREQTMLRLAKHFKVRVHGHYYKMFRTKPILGVDMVEAYKCSKIGLNFLYTHNPTELQMSDRFFKVMGCGSFLLTPHVYGIEKLFTPGKHFVEWNGISDLIDKVSYYLEHNEEREAIAIAGQKEVLEKHRIAVRVKQYEKHLQDVIKVKPKSRRVSSKNYV